MTTKHQTLIDALDNIGCLGKARDDEPVFVLRAQDALMPEIMLEWADRVDAKNGGPNEKTKRARTEAHAAREWQLLNGCKVPD